MKQLSSLVYLLMLFSAAIAQNELNFYTTKGEDKHNSKSDYQIIKADYELKDNHLIFRIEVQDDQFIFDENKLQSDHLEFWFTTKDSSSKIYKIDHEYTGYESFNYVLSERREEDPNNDFKQGIREDYVAHKQTLSYSYDELDSSFFDANVYSRYDFIGTSHWGIFKDSARLFDLKQYVDFPAQSPTHRPRTIFKETENGYRYEVHFSIGNLLFLSSTSMQTLRCNVVLFDQDDDGYSMHSTSKEYQWGEVKNFISLHFEEAFKSSLDEAYYDIEAYRDQGGPFFYYFDNERWQRYTVETETADWWDNVFPIFYESSSVKRKAIQFGKSQAFYYTEPYELFYFPPSKGNEWTTFIRNMSFSEYGYDEEGLGNEGDSIVIFPFNDSTAGFFTYREYTRSSWGRGPCGGCVTQVYSFYRVAEQKAHKILGIEVNDGKMTTYWSVEGIEGDYYPVMNSIEWDSTLNQMKIQANSLEEESDSQIFTIAWDEDWKAFLVKE